jgi:integrase
MTSELSAFNNLFPTDHADKNRRSRLTSYAAWLTVTGKGWADANLVEYRDYLLHTKGLRPISVRNHLATIRQRYRDLLEDNGIINALESKAYLECQAQGFTPDPANVQAVVNRWLRHIGNNISPNKAKVKVTKIKSHEDGRFVRLTEDQIDELLDSIPRGSLLGLRSAAIVALAYMCGLREQEVTDAEVDDLYQAYRGKPAFRVKRGKGDAKRMVIYGPMHDYLVIVEEWLREAGISEGRILRSIGMSGVIGDSLSVDSIQDCIKALSVDGLRPRPHDLRRSYARNLYLQGWPIEAIAENMGHESIETSRKYIGDVR